MTHLGFPSCKANLYMWIRETIKYDCSVYWEYVILYVGHVFCISMNAENVLKNETGKYFLIKTYSVGYPKIYLGNKVSKVTLNT